MSTYATSAKTLSLTEPLLLFIMMPLAALSLSPVKLSNEPNISELFSNYDKNVKPGPLNMQTLVNISFLFKMIEFVDETNDQVAIGLGILERWIDGRLQWSHNHTKQGTNCFLYPQVKLWNPALFAGWNVIAQEMVWPLNNEESQLKVCSRGDVERYRAFRIILGHPFELKNFPFDIQKVKFHYGTNIHASEFLDIQPTPWDDNGGGNEEILYTVSLADNTEWHISTSQGEDCKLSKSMDDDSVIECEFILSNVNRQPLELNTGPIAQQRHSSCRLRNSRQKSSEVKDTDSASENGLEEISKQLARIEFLLIKSQSKERLKGEHSLSPDAQCWLRLATIVCYTSCSGCLLIWTGIAITIIRSYCRHEN